MKKSIKILKIFIISIAIVFLGTICIKYKNAEKTAINNTAVYLSDNYWELNGSHSLYEFLSFKKTYEVVKLKNFKIEVNLTGTASMGRSINQRDTQFKSTVTIPIIGTPKVKNVYLADFEQEKE